MTKKNGSTVTPVPPNMILSDVEATLILNLRTMNDQGQKSINGLAAKLARAYPRRVAPKLSLIQGGVL